MLDGLANFASSVLTVADANGSGLAAIVAIIGVPLVIAQITQSARHENARKSARRYAALAALPMTLSGVNRWAEEAARALSDIYPWVFEPSKGAPVAPFSPPDSPDHLIEGMERMIEASPSNAMRRTLAAILSDIQVLNSRIGNEREWQPKNLRKQQGMIDSNLLYAARIHARADSLYDTARSLSEKAPIDYARVSSALNLMDIRKGRLATTRKTYPTVHQLLDRARQDQLLERSPFRKALDNLIEQRQKRAQKKQQEAIAAAMADRRREQKDIKDDAEQSN